LSARTAMAFNTSWFSIFSPVDLIFG